MPKDESLQHKLDRVRKPRVQITYDVEIERCADQEGIAVRRSASWPTCRVTPTPTPSRSAELKSEKRKFVEINRDNFDRVMAGHEAPAGAAGR